MHANFPGFWSDQGQADEEETNQPTNQTVNAIFSQTTPIIHPLNTGRKYSKELK